LSAALTARREKLSVVVLEQGTISDSIRKYPRKKLLLAEPLGIPLYGELWVADAAKETLLSVWEATIAEQQLDIRPHSRVEWIERQAGDRLSVSGEGFSLMARRVVLAMGRRGTPRRLGVPGEDLDKVYYDIVEMEQFAGRRVLVVGGGDSAIESFVGLANQPGTEVTLSYRRDSFDRAKPRNIEHLQEVVEQGRGRLLLQSQVLRIDPDSVDLERESQTTRLPNDEVIIRIGGEAPTRFLESLGIHMVTKEIPLVEAKAGVGDGEA
jgi:thioredoxin reductase